LLLRQAGLTHFKDRDVELRFESAPLDMNLRSIAPFHSQKPATAPIEAPLSPEKEQEIKHKVEEMVSLLKLDDKDLIDRLFPDTDGGSAEPALEP